MPTYAFANHRATEPLRRFLANCERRRYSAKAVIIGQDHVSRHLFFLGPVDLSGKTKQGGMNDPVILGSLQHQD